MSEGRTRPEARYSQELRFAVVMYGGSSLAIYINGVVQELLALVRATAPREGEAGLEALFETDDLKGAEHVYRKLGQIVSWQERGEALPQPTDRIRTRFVIDILSGTSAGGLNAIFLGKALAGEQDIAPLKSLWREQADLALLVNDKGSKGDTTLKPQKPPRSLLNSRRMYWQLLAALDSMESKQLAGNSRLVDELDCWITATDIRGLLLPIDTFDRFVFERRHKKVFQLVYRRGYDEPVRNDFRQDFNPFLAYAGRCTSAFPFAFEPMQLADIDEVVEAERFRDRYGKLGSAANEWKRFFEEYFKGGDAEVLQRAEAGDPRVEAYRRMSFGDGGYLDNKPFTHATRNLTLRRQTIPVERRLFYVEPDPNGRPPVERLEELWREHGPLADIVGTPPERPNALENVMAALFTLPRVEAIREDIEALNDRNRDIARVGEISLAVDKALRDGTVGQEMPPIEEWRAMSAQEWMRRRGVEYSAYYRLHVATVLDDLARTVTRAAGFDENSDEQAAIRCFVQAWANRRYPESGTGRESQNDFVLRFDLEYRIRRIQFLQRRIDELLRDEYVALARLLDFAGAPAAEARMPAVRDRLYALKGRLDKTLGDLRAADLRLWFRSGGNPLLPLLAEVGIDRAMLREILDGALTKEQSVARAAEKLDSPRYEAFERVADAIAGAFEPAFDKAREETGAALAGDDADPWVDAAVRAIRSDFDNYWLYDAVVFPIAYGRLGEADRVEVVRISPEDAPSIIDQLKDPRRKLAGTSVHHFGGFLDERWRRNDMLWGRLDAAERIIDTVLVRAPQELRETLRHEAQLAIVKDEFPSASTEELSRQLIDVALATRPGGPLRPIDPVDRARLEAAVAGLRDPDQILEFLKSGYEVDRRLKLDVTVRTAGRAAVVTGHVLDGITDDPRARVVTKWIARMGRLLWGFAELAAPRTPGRLLRYWFWVLALVGILMIAVGIALTSDPTTHAGWVLVWVLVGVAVTTWVLRDVFSRRARALAAEPSLGLRPPPPPRWKRVLHSRLAWVLAAVIVAVLGLAVLESLLHLEDDIRSLW